VAEVDLAKKQAFTSPGLEVYSSTGEFPSLAIGDVVEFSGKVSEIQGKKRINMQKDSSINILDHWDVPEPEVMATGEVSEDLIGSLVSVSGTLLDKKSGSYFLDDGSGEIKVYFKKTASIKDPAIKAGEILAVNGILDVTSSGYRLLPRFTEDVKAGRVLSVSEPAKEEIINIAGDHPERKIKKYLLWGGGGALVLLLVALLKKTI